MATVLVVDDEFGIAELFEAVLADEGYRVLTAINGRHGLEVLAKERPDLIFLDFMMPVMDGAGMLRGMEADAMLHGIQVVMMSSMPEAAVSERCSGYASFIRKPFRIDQVVAVTKRLLHEGRNPTEVAARSDSKETVSRS
jgi:DNA-binding NtrC family response regulator